MISTATNDDIENDCTTPRDDYDLNVIIDIIMIIVIKSRNNHH